MKTTNIEPMNLIFSIVERGKGTAISSLFTGQMVHQHLQCAGRGTATSEIMDLLGLDGLEKDVVISFAKATLANKLLYGLNGELRNRISAKGIIFDIPLTGMGQLAALAMLAQVKFETGREINKMDTNADYNMIMVTVNQGFTEEVMATARKAGARGGTIIHARWSGSESVEQVFNITLQAEKEIILIVSATDKRDEIMQAINHAHGIQTDAKSIVCSFAINSLVHVG